MCHEVVDYGEPARYTRHVHLEEAGIHHQLKGLTAPGFTCVLVAADRSQELGGCTQTGQVVGAGNTRRILESLSTGSNSYRNWEAARRLGRLLELET